EVYGVLEVVRGYGLGWGCCYDYRFSDRGGLEVFPALLIGLDLGPILALDPGLPGHAPILGSHYRIALSLDLGDLCPALLIKFIGLDRGLGGPFIGLNPSFRRSRRFDLSLLGPGDQDHSGVEGHNERQAYGGKKRGLDNRPRRILGHKPM